MICSIHQPNYIPYLGLLNKILQSDVFVFYDIAQYTKGDYHNRNKIKTPNGGMWLTIPVSVSSGQTILQTSFNSTSLSNHWKTIQHAYGKAPFFLKYKQFFEEMYSYSGDNLSQFNIHTIVSLCQILGIKTKFVTLSDLAIKLETSSTDALVDICNLVGADSYLSGAGGKGYIEEDKFKTAGINLSYQDFHHPVYNQLWGDFLPYMSIIDLIMNEGDRSIEFIS